MPNYRQNKNESRTLELSCGEFPNHCAVKPNVGLSVAELGVLPQHDVLSSAVVCTRHISQFLQHSMIIVGNLFGLMLFLWAAPPPLIHAWSIHSSLSPWLYLPVSISSLFLHTASFSIPLSALGKLSAFNEFHCHGSTARSDPYHHFDCNTRSLGLSGNPTLAPRSSATVNYDETPN